MAEPYDNVEDQATNYSDPLEGLLLDNELIDDEYYGAVIDMDDNEQIITEKMILDACEALEKEIDSIYRHEFSDK